MGAAILRIVFKAVFDALQSLVSAVGKVAGSLVKGPGSGSRSGGFVRTHVKITSRMDWAKRAMDEAVKGALEACAEEAGKVAKQRAPVLTRRLRDSIHRTPLMRTANGYTIAIGTDVEYAPMVE